MIITATGYTFNPANKTVSFNTSTGQPLPPSLESILTITNCSNSNSKGERLLYQPQAGDDLSGNWNSSTSTLTLAVNCAGMQGGDRLQILFEDQSALKVNVVAGSVASGGSALSTSELQAAGNQSLVSIDSRIGTTGTGAPALPSGASGLAGLTQVLYQALLDRLPAALSSGRLLVDANLPTGAATATNQVTTNTALSTANDRLGPADETAPASDTASAGLNGRLQRLAQRLSSILTKLPAFSTAGSPSSDVLTVQGTTAGQALRIATGVLAEASYTSTAGFPTGVIPINTQLVLLDCGNCSAVSIQAVSLATGGSIVAEWSNNGANFGPTVSLPIGSVGSSWGTAIAAAGVYVIPRLGKWLQLRQSVASTGGTTSLSVVQLADSPTVNAIAQLAPSTSGVGSIIQSYSASATFAGATKTSIFSAASTNAAAIKGSAGKVLGFWLTNTTAAPIMLRLYNLAASPTVGTSATFARIVVPPNGFVTGGLAGGYLHSTGIAIAITAGLADNDTTSVTAGAIIGELFTI